MPLFRAVFECVLFYASHAAQFPRLLHSSVSCTQTILNALVEDDTDRPVFTAAWHSVLLDPKLMEAFFYVNERTFMYSWQDQSRHGTAWIALLDLLPGTRHLAAAGRLLDHAGLGRVVL